jgi:hypothetical protein
MEDFLKHIQNDKIRKIILIPLFLLFFCNISLSQNLIGKTLTAGPKSDKFKFVSKNKVIWTNSLDEIGVVKKKKLKYDYKNGLLRITLYWKVDGFIEAETYYLHYDYKNNVFIDREVDMMWYFVRDINKKK